MVMQSTSGLFPTMAFLGLDLLTSGRLVGLAKRPCGAKVSLWVTLVVLHGIGLDTGGAVRLLAKGLGLDFFKSFLMPILGLLGFRRSFLTATVVVGPFAFRHLFGLGLAFGPSASIFLSMVGLSPFLI